MSQSNQVFTGTVTIAASGTVSTVLRMGSEFSIIGVRTDANWTTSNITIESSMEDPQTASPSAFLSCVDGSNVALKLTAIAASKQVCLSQDWPVIPGNFMRFTAATTQTSATTLTVTYRMT